jgi:hypothetical protein
MKNSFPIKRVMGQAIIIGVIFPYFWMLLVGSGERLDESAFESPEFAQLHGVEREEYLRTQMRPETFSERIVAITKISVTHWDFYLFSSTLVAMVVYSINLGIWYSKKNAP